LPETDAWGNRYTYRVGTKFGRDAGQSRFDNGCNPTPPPTLAGFALCTSAAIMLNSAASGGTQLVSYGVPAIVVSHGKNGLGAYTPQGMQLPAAAAGSDEAANSDGDATFVANTAIDDQLVWVPTNVLMNRMVAAGMLP
jgi:hypothetical protein